MTLMTRPAAARSLTPLLLPTAPPAQLTPPCCRADTGCCGAGLTARAIDVGARARTASRTARAFLIDDIRRRALGTRDPERRVVGSDTALALRSILERRCARQTALAERLRSVRHLPRLGADLAFATRCAHLPNAASGTVALVFASRRRGTLCPGVAQRWCIAAGPVARDDIRRQALLTDAEG